MKKNKRFTFDIFEMIETARDEFLFDVFEKIVFSFINFFKSCREIKLLSESQLYSSFIGVGKVCSDLHGAQEVN